MPPALNVLVPGISVASVEILLFLQNGQQENLDIYGLENTLLHILHDLGYILHSPKPLLFVCTFQ